MLLLRFLQNFSDYSRCSGGQVEQLVTQFYNLHNSYDAKRKELTESYPVLDKEVCRTRILSIIFYMLYISGLTGEFNPNCEAFLGMLQLDLQYDGLCNYGNKPDKMHMLLTKLIEKTVLTEADKVTLLECVIS